MRRSASRTRSALVGVPWGRAGVGQGVRTSRPGRRAEAALRRPAQPQALAPATRSPSVRTTGGSRAAQVPAGTLTWVEDSKPLSHCCCEGTLLGNPESTKRTRLNVTITTRRDMMCLRPFHSAGAKFISNPWSDVRFRSSVSDVGTAP